MADRLPTSFRLTVVTRERRIVETDAVEVVLPAYECFKADPIRGKAIMASFAAWHIQEWIWHEQRPGEDTRRSKDYQSFQKKRSS